MKKRLLSIALCLTVVINLFTVIPANAETNQASLNVATLESLLHGDRQFVIDTLIGDNYKTDFSTNPHAAVNNVAGEKTMMDNALSQYRNKDDPNYSGAYKAAVDLMEIAYEGDDYTQDILDFVLEFAADITELFGLDAESTIRDLTKSVGELKYESVIKEVLSGDYTSSDGVTLSSKEMQYEELEHLVSNVKKVNNFAKNLKTIMSSDFISEDAYMNRLDYYENYMIPYAKSYSEAANAIVADLGGSTDETSKWVVMALAGMVHMMKYETNNVYVKSDIVNYAPEAFIKAEALNLIGVAGTLSKTTCTTLSAYMYINDIAMQTESLKGVLDRTARNAPHDMANVLERYSEAIGEAGNAKLMAYETLMKYIRDEGVVNTLVDEVGEAVATKVTNKIENKIGKKLSETKAGIAKTTLTSVLSKATSYAGVAGWCVDKATNFKTTCKKTYELKYLENVIKEAVDTYNRDLAVYYSNKSDENAKNVLYDLQFIQKLRLRGEAIAYNMVVSQTDSMLGKLLGLIYATPSETLVESLTANYQQRVNAFIGASILPYCTDALTVKKGEKVTVLYNSSNGLYASCTNGTMAYGIAELDQRVLNGITVETGGELTIALNTAKAYIPFVKNNGGSVYINSVGEIPEITTNSGTTTLGPSMSYVQGIYLGGGTLNSNDIEMLNCDMLVSTGGTAAAEIPITTKLIDVAGRINGKTVYLTGNSNGGGGIIQNLYLCGKSQQTLRGVTGAENITYDNQKGIIQEGTVKISGNLKNIDTKLKNAKNTTLVDGGYIGDGYYKQDITIAGKSGNNFVEYEGVVYVNSTASMGSAKINNMIYQTGGTLTVNGTLEIMDYAKFAGNVTQTEGEYKLYGNSDFSGTTKLHNLVLCSDKEQSITGAMTVNDYTNQNTVGVKIGNKINVEGVATSVKAPISGASNVTLVNNGRFGDSKFYGDVSIGTLTGSLPPLPKTHYAIYVIGTVNQTQDDSITHALNINGGTLNVKDCNFTMKNKLSLNSGTINIQNAVLKCDSSLTTAGKINIDENSRLETKYELVNSGTVMGKGSVYMNGNITNSGTFSNLSTVEVKGNIANNGTFNFDKLSVIADADRSISGNAITLKNFEATGSKKITLSNNINVSEGYNIGNTKIDTTKIKKTTSTEVVNEDVYYSGLQLTNSALTIKENSNVKCGGNLSISNSSLTVSDNSTLYVWKNADLTNVNIILGNNSKIVFYSKVTVSGGSSNSITIDETSELVSKNLMNISSLGNVTVNGSMLLGSDAILKSTKLGGNGNVTLIGDLYTTSTTNLLVNRFNISGKFAQRINGSGLQFNNLTISNNSTNGVTFDTAYYNGELVGGNAIINGTLTKIEEESVE